MAKKQPAKQEEKNGAFYVGVANASTVRKTMLETSRELLMSLKQYEHLRNIRAQKSALYTQYNTQIASVKSLMVKLQRAIPKHDMSALIAKQEKAKSPVVEQKTLAPVEKATPKERMPKGTVAAIDEVTRLEAELAAIEAKLTNM